MSVSWNVYENGRVVPMPDDFKARMNEQEIPIEYEYLAREPLRELLREYYSKHRIQNIGAGTKALEDFLQMMEKVKEQAEGDMKVLQDTYNTSIETLQGLMDE